MNNAPAPDVLQEDLTLLVPPAPAATPGHGVAWGIAAGVLVVGAIVWCWWRRRARVEADPAARLESAGEIALRALSACASLPRADGNRAAVAAISQAVRQYVEARFGLRAPTLTTEEFWALQRARRAIPDAQQALLADFTAVCDEIKYAGRHASEEQFQMLLGTARSFVEVSHATKTGAALAPR